MRRAEGSANSMTDRNRAIASVLEAIFADENRQFACSELTLLEFHSNITTNLRSNANRDWDYDWWKAARGSVLADIGSGKIEILAPPAKSTEHVMSLVTLATQTYGRALKAWDAMHAVVAGRWAYDNDANVVILTSDDDFDKALTVTNFGDRVSFQNLDVLASTGCGMDKNSS
jgi:hypothetical protein